MVVIVPSPRIDSNISPEEYDEINSRSESWYSSKRKKDVVPELKIVT